MKHKCIDCGYLSRRNSETHNLDEVERDENGRVASGNYQSDIMYSLSICFARERKLQSEYRKIEKFEIERGILNSITTNEQVVTIIRKCKSFTKWQQGFTPKEHREMMDREREKRFHIIEIILILIVTLIASIGSAIVGALIANGKI